ncbi:activating signal cointegrator 1 complex subunit 3-like, partial [Carlito syrichta]|uniref:Activating signal cointegrator 1 complex subunit 3-like n=1 Tax=Carlito syrichta TaxID=1868482 RepID=A0A1U7UEH8_CARSF
DAEEYTDLPVRHNEDHMNSELAKCLPVELNPHSFDSPHTKAHLLLQAHLSRAMLPCPDYDTDTKTVLDQALRVCQAMLDVAANQGWLVTVLNITNLVQMVIQGRWLKDSSLLTLPNIEHHHLHLFRKWKPVVKGTRARCRTSIECLPELIHACGGKDHIFSSMIESELHAAKTKQAWNFLSRLPVINVGMSVKGSWGDSVEGHGERSVSTLTADKRDDNRWIRLHADQEYVLQVSLQRVPVGFHKGKQESCAVTPRFPKSKDEGWFLILGEVDRRELIALKRVGYVRNHHVASLSFYTPEVPGRYIYTLYFMSDCYLGLDQQYDIYLNVTQANISTQVNMEVSDALADLAVK